MKKIKTAIFFLFVIFLFALDNPISAALPANELWREDLINNVIGFGKNTTGGKGGTLCQVTNLNDSGTGSLAGMRGIHRAKSGSHLPYRARSIYRLSFTCPNPDKTIDGRGADITIENQGIIIGWWGSPIQHPVSNIIIHNLKFKNETGGRMIAKGQLRPMCGLTTTLFKMRSMRSL